jgi:hypothetical protein
MDSIYYCYERDTGLYAGSGTPHIDTDTHGSTLDAPTFSGDRCVQTFDTTEGRWRTTWLPGAAFALRFTPSEIDAIEQSDDANVQAALAGIQQAPWVWLDAPETQAGVAAIVADGIISPARAAVILAPAD